MEGLIGRKQGMTQVYDEKGRMVPVTVIEAGPCVVIQRKTKEKDGYSAVQLGFSEQKESRLNKAALGRFKKIGVKPVSIVKEFPVNDGDEIKDGDMVKVSIFEGVSHVDVVGITKGRGFGGVVRRYRMGGGPITHGGHSKRRIGSIGQNSFPARVNKGHRMPGHMGNVRRSQVNLKLVAVQGEDNLILVKGAIPGAIGSVVCVKKSLKKRG